MAKENKLCVKELVVLSLLGTITFGAKLAMSVIPNVEPVTLILAVTALVYERKSFYTCFVYVMLEGLVYGFGVWWISYLYAWAIWVEVVILLKEVDSYTIWTMFAGIFGLCFGALCALPYLFIGGFEMAFSYWAAGAMYDILHFIGNILVCGVLMKPLHILLQNLSSRTIRTND